jgi:hypothetical protein
VRAQGLLASRLAQARDVQPHPCDDRRQPAALVLDAARVGALRRSQASDGRKSGYGSRGQYRGQTARDRGRGAAVRVCHGRGGLSLRSVLLQAIPPRYDRRLRPRARALEIPLDGAAGSRSGRSAVGSEPHACLRPEESRAQGKQTTWNAAKALVDAWVALCLRFPRGVEFTEGGPIGKAMREPS